MANITMILKSYMKRQRKNLKRSHKKEGVDKYD